MEAAVRLRKERTELVLVSAGWILGKDGGWRHERLNASLFPWPASYAVRLQRESDDGMQDLAHRMLRGEA